MKDHSFPRGDYSKTFHLQNHVFTLQGIEISNLVTIHYTNVEVLRDWFYRHQMEPITDDFSLRKQNMFVVEIWKVKIVHPVNSD